MDDLTPRQRQVLQYVTRCIEEHGCPPTLREIGRELGITSNLAVLTHLRGLEQKGYLSRRPGARGVTLAGRGEGTVRVPIVGTVRAGALSLAVEEIEGYLAIDRARLPGEGAFFLRVKGDSMINAAIVEGDLALVRPQTTAENRDIVVAMVEGEATLKRFYRERGQIRLQPENPNLEAIIIRPGEGEVTIVGKVVGIYREL